MDTFELLKADHRRVHELFQQLVDTTERAVKTRQELFPKLQMELDVHARIEEEIFYPATLAKEETHKITSEAYAEHDLVKKLLVEIEALPIESEEWAAEMTVLMENVEHHVGEEEEEISPQAQKLLSQEEIESLGDQLAAAKEEYMNELMEEEA